MRAEWIWACLLCGNVVLLFFVASPGWWLLGSVAVWGALFASGALRWTSAAQGGDLKSYLSRPTAGTSETYTIQRACHFHVPALLENDLIPVPGAPVQEGVSFYFFELQDGRMFSLAQRTLQDFDFLDEKRFPAQQITITRAARTGAVLQLATRGEMVSYEQRVCILPLQNYALIQAMPLLAAEGVPSELLGYAEIVAMFSVHIAPQFAGVFGQIPVAPDETADMDVASASLQQALLTERYCPLRVLYFNHPQSGTMIWFVELSENLLLCLCGGYLQGESPLRASVITLLRHKQSGRVLGLTQEGQAVAAVRVEQPSYFGAMKLHMPDGQFCAGTSLDEIQCLLA